jgi:hypothetical protein
VGVVAVVDVVEVVLVAVVAAAPWLWVEDEDADPHALTSSVSRTAASGMRMCLMLARTPPPTGCFPSRTAGADLNRR